MLLSWLTPRGREWVRLLKTPWPSGSESRALSWTWTLLLFPGSLFTPHMYVLVMYSWILLYVFIVLVVEISNDWNFDKVLLAWLLVMCWFHPYRVASFDIKGKITWWGCHKWLTQIHGFLSQFIKYFLFQTLEHVMTDSVYYLDKQVCFFLFSSSAEITIELHLRD